MKGRFLIKRRFNWSETPLKVFIGGEFLVICLGHEGESQETQRVPTAQLEVGDEKGLGNLRRSLRDAGLEWQQTTEIFSLFGDCKSLTFYIFALPAFLKYSM